MGRTKFYESADEMQKDLDTYLLRYDTKRPYKGLNMNSMTLGHYHLKGLKYRPKNEKKKEVITA